MRSAPACQQPRPFRLGSVFRTAVLLALLGLCLDAQAVSILKTDYRAATVFRDRNSNGQLDEVEKRTAVTTDDNGRCKLPKGKKGNLTLVGGFDITSGLPNTLSALAAPPKARSIGTLTALWQALLDRKLRAKRAKRGLGLKSNESIGQYEAGSIAMVKPSKRHLSQVASQQTTLVKFLKSLTLGASSRPTIGARTAIAAATEDEVVGIRADGLRANNGQPENLTDRDQVQGIMSRALNQIGTVVNAETTLTTATIASRLNRLAMANPAQLDTLAAVIDNASDLIRRGSTADYQYLNNYFDEAALQQQLNGDVFLSYPRDLNTSPPPDGDGFLSVSTFLLQGSMPLGNINRVDHIDVYVDDVLEESSALLDPKKGLWNHSVTNLSDGVHSLRVRAVNLSGTEGAESEPLIVRIRTRLPPTPTPTPTVSDPTYFRFVNATSNLTFDVFITGVSNPVTTELAPWHVALVGPVQAGLTRYEFRTAGATPVRGEVNTFANKRYSIVVYLDVGTPQALKSSSAAQLDPGGCGTEGAQVAFGQFTGITPNPAVILYTTDGGTSWTAPIAPGLNTGQIFGSGCWNLSSVQFGVGPAGATSPTLRYEATPFTASLTYQLLMTDDRIISIDNLDRITSFPAQPPQ